jgi:hypothetical protein
MRIKILGKYYNLKFATFLGHSDSDKEEEILGKCSDPNEVDRQILIKKGINPKLELDVISHECFHAFLWNHDEVFIEQFGTEFAEILWKLGYRRLTKEQRKTLEIE